MAALDVLASSCAVLVVEDDEGLHHLGTAWSVGPGEWVTACSADPDTAAAARLLCGDDQRTHELHDWECDGPIVGFRSVEAREQLPMADEGALRKAAPLHAIGYACLIEHPAFRLHRGSLDAERYHPYLCPWCIDGHLALFSKEEGWLRGGYYPGLNGSPVLGEDGRVVGVVLDGSGGGEQPLLTRFWRLV